MTPSAPPQDVLRHMCVFWQETLLLLPLVAVTPAVKPVWRVQICNLLRPESGVSAALVSPWCHALLNAIQDSGRLEGEGAVDERRAFPILSALLSFMRWVTWA